MFLDHGISMTMIKRMFNDSRSISDEEPNKYRILEDIKDGAATTSKYDNHRIKFLTSNYVLVFSNSFPNMKHLSQDRWQILEPMENGLKPMDKQQIRCKCTAVRFDCKRKNNEKIYKT